jgi:chromosome partitioning protein
MMVRRESMSKVLAVANQKGGVAKTTTCINLAASLAATKRRVLLIDFDPQGNATVGSGVNKTQISITANDVLLGQASIAAAVMSTPGHYQLLPANGDLTVATIKLMQLEQREYQLQQALEAVRGDYDFVLIDCPPALNMLTVNALVAADGVLIPMQCEYYSLEGLAGLLSTIERLRRACNPKLEIAGILRTMYDGRNRLTLEVSEQLFQHFGEKVFQTVIPRNVRLAEAPSHGLPILQYDDRSQGAAAYLALAGEMIRRVSQQPMQTQNSSEMQRGVL